MATSDPPEKKESNFWDSTWALVLLVAAIVLARMYILEPFKIPSGSMEPTLVGHEDYGDRIVTNKLAYATAKQAVLVMLGAALVILVGFVVSRSWKRKRSIAISGALLLLTVGGMGFAWSRGVVAGEPQRFDVAVFQYNTEWDNNPPYRDINYIKRLCGLPGETILISGGDLHRVEKLTGKPQIIRKWQASPSMQDAVWYPIALAWHPLPQKDVSPEDRERIALPWNGAEAGAAGVERLPAGLNLTGAADVELNYAYPATNVHLKQGRWSFEHENCPEATKEGVKSPSGIVFSNPDNKTKYVWAYVSNTWDGVQCPNCKQIMFPAAPGGSRPVRLTPVQGGRMPGAEHTPDLPEFTKFFYGGEQVVGDLKLDVEIDVERPGTVQLDVGNNFHRAHWTIPSPDGDAEAPEGVHAVQARTPALAPGKHRLSLAYVDATVVAILDGQEIERRPIDGLAPLGDLAPKLQSVARITFSGMQGTVSRLDLYRDLYYTPHINKMSQRQPSSRRLMDHEYTADVPADSYLMLGDNSPSSSDGRVWGFVPRERMIGRASVIWWPPSRWGAIK